MAFVETPDPGDIYGLVWQAHVGTATPEQLTDLERLVCQSPLARRLYVRYMQFCADLSWSGMLNVPLGPGAESMDKSTDIGEDTRHAPQ